MHILYDALLGNVEPKLQRMRYYGIIVDRELRVDSLETSERHSGEAGERREEDHSSGLQVHTKHAPPVAARFKAYSYLHEFDADCVVVVAPYPERAVQVSDEEAYEQCGFYLDVARYGGAIVEVDEDGRMLAVVYADPSPDSVERGKLALTRVLRGGALLAPPWESWSGNLYLPPHGPICVGSNGDTTVRELREVVRRFVKERGWERYHNLKDLALALAVEAAELLDVFK